MSTIILYFWPHLFHASLNSIPQPKVDCYVWKHGLTSSIVTDVADSDDIA